MAYLVLARRWRPRRFSELIGQDVVVRTLKNALRAGKIAHAYLLCGIRGVGKTTIARLMAMAVNCERADDGEPCGECAACVGISAGSNLDVREMDAASHTGVDDVREILNSVRYPPGSLKTKVYIIDEAHMLSKSAFNALLKTLEEPPDSVMFILATTEPEKLPVTVRSRCQRFDLRRLGQGEIRAHLAHVFEKEGVAADDEAIAAIAQAADGSMRDALSLAERVLAYDNERLTLAAVEAALGMVSGALVRELSAHIFAGESEQALQCFRQGVARGHAPRGILREMGRLWHRLACAMVDASLLSEGTAPDEEAWLREQMERLTQPMLDLHYQVLLAGLRDLSLMDELLSGEMLVLRLSGLHRLLPVSEGGARTDDSAPRAGDDGGEKQRMDAAAHRAGMTSAGRKAIASEHPAEQEGLDLPLRQDQERAARYDSWEEAVDAFANVRPGVAAMLEHVVCLEFASRVRLALDRHQQRAIAPADRLAFAEWLGREVLWEARREGDGESLSQERARRAEAETARLRRHAEQDPHVQALMKELNARLVDVSPPGADHQAGEME